MCGRFRTHIIRRTEMQISARLNLICHYIYILTLYTKYFNSLPSMRFPALTQFLSFADYKVTPCLKIAKSWKPAISAFTFLPEATSNTSWKSSLAASSSGRSSVTILPALKSIQLLLLPASLELVAIFTVGTGDAMVFHVLL